MLHGALYLRNAPVRRGGTFNLVDHGNIRRSPPVIERLCFTRGQEWINYTTHLYISQAFGTVEVALNPSPAIMVGGSCEQYCFPFRECIELRAWWVQIYGSKRQLDTSVLNRFHKGPFGPNQAGCLVVEGWQGGRRENFSVTASR